MGYFTERKFLRFIAVGIVNTVVGMAVMFGLYNICGCSYWISSAANYILVSILSYLLNRRFTFRYGGEVLRSGLRFAVNIGVCYFAAYGIAKPLAIWILQGQLQSIQENAAMAAGMCIFTCMNYIGQRFFVFRENDMKNTDTNHREEYKRWIESPYLSNEEKSQLEAMGDEEIYEAFYKRLEFGTAGMRGIMGLGTNRLNKYTVRMAARGLAEELGEGARVAIAYDTRLNSRQLAMEAARTLAAAGVKVLIFDRYSPVPLLSFTVRNLACNGGIVITASHNIKTYNGFKVYDETGCQLCDEAAERIARNIEKLEDKLAVEISEADDENISYIGREATEQFLQAVLHCGTVPDIEAAEALRVVYTPLHGSGREYVMETLKRAGFNDVLLVEEQSDYNGEFPTVKKPNPEDPAVFAIAEKIALEAGGDIIIGTDPDSDRIGVGVRDGDNISYLSGNQTGTLIVDFLAAARGAAGKTLITSIVTGDMGASVAKSYGAQVVRTYTGFKNLGKEMNKLPEDRILMAYEESFGYLAGTHIRDKDGVSASLIVCQMAAYWKKRGYTLTEAMEMLYEKHGYYVDRQSSFVFEGAAGAKKIEALMERFRAERGEAFKARGKVDRLIDYSDGIEGLPPANVLKYIFENGSWLAVRPSGTEPKIKFYYCIRGNDRKAAENMYLKLKENVEKIMESI